MAHTFRRPAQPIQPRISATPSVITGVVFGVVTLSGGASLAGDKASLHVPSPDPIAVGASLTESVGTVNQAPVLSASAGASLAGADSWTVRMTPFGVAAGANLSGADSWT